MIVDTPIFIAGPPRSGTTMLAGLLSMHGVWVGRGRTTYYPGTNSNVVSENQDIKMLMKREASNIGYKNWDTPLPFATKIAMEQLKKEVELFVEEDSKWLVKTTWLLAFYDFWIQAYPRAKWVFTSRSTEKIMNSMERHPGMRKRDRRQRLDFVKALKDRQRMVSERVEYTYVDVKKISQRDEYELKNFFEFTGVDYCKERVNEFLKPEMFA